VTSSFFERGAQRAQHPRGGAFPLVKLGLKIRALSRAGKKEGARGGRGWVLLVPKGKSKKQKRWCLSESDNKQRDREQE